MKILKIEDSKGSFLSHLGDDTTPEQWTLIDQIDKNGLMALLDIYIKDDYVEMDSYNEHPIANPAQQIIYASIFNKFNTLAENKSKFKEAGNSLYWDEIKKYEVRETDEF